MAALGPSFKTTATATAAAGPASIYTVSVTTDIF
jgi:hypothetical protein